MKNLMYKFSFLLLMLNLIGCTDIQQDTMEESYGDDHFVPFTFENLDVKASSMNEEDEEVNKKLLALAEAFKAIAGDKSISSTIIDYAKKEKTGYVSLATLMQLHPRITNYLSSSTGPDLNGASPFTFIYHQKEYEVVINVPNIDRADFNLSPIVSPGIEVEGYAQVELSDAIFGWRLNDDNSSQGIIIDESQALNTDIPVFVLTPHPTNESGVNIGSLPHLSVNDEGDNVGFRTITYYHSNEHMVSDLYEGSGCADFCITAFKINPDGSSGPCLKVDNGYDTWKKISSVCGTSIEYSVWSHFSDDFGSNRDDFFIFFNTYERDWYSSFKALGGGTANGTTGFLSGRMKFSDEWYAFDPVGSDQYFDIVNCHDNWVNVYTSKGYIKIWRVEL